MIYTPKRQPKPLFKKTAWLSLAILTAGAWVLGHWAMGWTVPEYAEAVVVRTAKAEVKEVVEPTPEEVADRIIAVAKEKGYGAPLYLVRLAKCESSLNPTKIGTAVGCPSCKGIFQIHTKANKVTDDQAFDVEWSTAWTIDQLVQGHYGKWPVCTKIIS